MEFETSVSKNLNEDVFLTKSRDNFTIDSPDKSIDLASLPNKTMRKNITKLLEHTKDWHIKISEWTTRSSTEAPRNEVSRTPDYPSTSVSSKIYQDDFRTRYKRFVISFRGDSRTGMKGTPYENVTLKILVCYSPSFPFVPPVFGMITPIFHPNVSENGIICKDKLHSECPAEGLEHNFLNLISLLIDPSLDDVMNLQAAQIFIEDPETYYEIARSFVAKLVE